MNDIKRKIELWLCQELRMALPEQRFFPLKGGDDTNDAAVIEPPYTIVEAREAEKFIQDEPTWTVETALTLVTHIDEVSTPAHSVMVREIYEAVVAIGHGYNPEQGLIVHGVDVGTTESVENEEKQIHGDVFMLTVAASDSETRDLAEEQALFLGLMPGVGVGRLTRAKQSERLVLLGLMPGL